MTTPGTIIGYRKNGMPIRLQAGGSEPTPPAVPPVTINMPPAPPTGEQYFTAAQLEAARQQEKDKVYGRLEAAEQLAQAMRAEVETLKSKEAQREAEVAARQAEAEAAARAAAEEKLSVAELIAAREKELLAKQEAFEQEMRLKQAVIEKEQQFIQMQAYISSRVNEEMAQGNLAPEFLDYITGNTTDEVEASITKAKEKTASIAEARAKALGHTRPGVSPTGAGLTGPMDQLLGQPQEPTDAQIAAMSMAEYAQYRAARGIDKAGKDRGMFG